MKYKIEYTQKAVKEFLKLGKQTQINIQKWVKKHLVGCEDPRLHGKALTADKKGLWRYRVGDYRLIADIQDEKILILILTVGHRKEIYE